MPTIKAVLRPPKNKQGQKPIYIRISDAGKTRYISTGLVVKPGLWLGNAKSDKWVKTNDAFDAAHLNKIISDKIKAIKDEAYQLQADNQNVNADILKRKAKSKEFRGSFIEYGKSFAKEKRRVNVRTGKRYDAVIAKVEEYTGGKLQFKDMTVTWLKDFSGWLADEKDNSPNTIHSNLRCIRAILYEAIRENQFPQEKNPFFKFKLKQPKVSRVKLSADEIKILANTETNDNPVQQMALDMFLFSFFTYGMRYSDVVQLKWKNVEGDFIRYEMRKTKEAHSVKIFPPARAILDKYSDNSKPDNYIFPVLNTKRNLENRETLVNEISSKNAYLNKELNNLRNKAGLSKRVSFHTARHSYADIARKKGTDLHAISNSLGHASLKTTEGYLKALDNETTDKKVQSVYEEF